MCRQVPVVPVCSFFYLCNRGLVEERCISNIFVRENQILKLERYTHEQV